MHNVGSETSCCSCCCGIKLLSSGWVKLLGLVHWCVKGVLMLSLLRLLGWQSSNWQSSGTALLIQGPPLTYTRKHWASCALLRHWFIFCKEGYRPLHLHVVWARTRGPASSPAPRMGAIGGQVTAGATSIRSYLLPLGAGSVE
jgi:hypothetical protein